MLPLSAGTVEQALEDLHVEYRLWLQADRWNYLEVQDVPDLSSSTDNMSLEHAGPKNTIACYFSLSKLSNYYKCGNAILQIKSL